MRLNETIITEIDPIQQPISEALRVTNQDINRMMQMNQNDFRIGIEAEFHLSEDRDDTSATSELQTQAEEIASDDLENGIGSDLIPLARIGSTFMNIFVDGNDFISALYGEEPDEGDDPNEQRLMELAQAIHQSRLSFSTALEGESAFEQGMPGKLVNSMKMVYYDIFHASDMENVMSFFSKNENDVENMLDEIEEVIGMSSTPQMAIRHIVNEVKGSDWYAEELERRTQIQVDILRGDQTGDSNIDYVIDMLPSDISNKSDVELDPSVTNGVEIISRPLMPREAFEYLDDIFDFIKMHGSTSSQTGLHINISHRSFSQGRLPDPLKIMALMDVDAFQDATNIRRHTKYPERNYMVEQITSNIAQPMALIKLAQAYIQGGFIELEDMMKHILVREVKYVSVNWSHFLKDFDPDQKRIEFRFPGGEGYENRFKEITDDIKFMMYVIQAVTNSSYKPETYFRGLYRIIDRAAKRAGFSSFNEVLQDQRRG